ncbi:hypothetical protein [Clostridium cylindrosporum]|uniref:Uncharacterized protein n=1 Tax=Clostridium cylindrosporum DSM 605 TaxID=1121307 RepID=A0A0J8D6M1_CLOCY|nr:hypothetical protein [Clostridium cylindrosporum]KMT21730.1 hypothetical protein CLCY_2c04940 [Clostridium cylindrosporum DSM 605]
MYDAKNTTDDNSRKGSLRSDISDRQYFNIGLDHVYFKGHGFYGNIHHNIFKKFK